MMSEKKWKILADLLMEIQKMGKTIPTNVMNDLRSAKTIIQVLKANPTDTESITRAETYLKNVEAYTISVAEEKGTQTVQEWLKRINQTEIKKQEPKQHATRPKVPQDKKWIRIKNTDELLLEDVKKLSKNSELSVKKEKNGDILVYGAEKDVKALVKTIAKQFQSSKKD